ncbi:hypothetical protein PSCICP_11560 [Pseudomonas cichorii]|uniref:Uncharacterized protein n=1 Tax=Pseudomonas cichorii TaxID=36746 RepID=A0ABQ1DJK2_PSECI|nr:hypothetical protein PSCICP_11560 [Pseudomonas cichorii]
MRFEVQPPSVSAIAVNEAARKADLRIKASPKEPVAIRLRPVDAVTAPFLQFKFIQVSYSDATCSAMTTW